MQDNQTTPLAPTDTSAPSSTPDILSTTTEQPSPQPPINAPAKKKSKTGIIIAIIIAIVAVIGIVVAIIIINQNQPSDNNEQTKRTTIEPAKERYNTYEKLALEYQSNGIGIAEYFAQLVYLETDTSKLDPIYKSDYGIDYGTSHFDEICSIIEKHYSDLDKDLVKQFLLAYSQEGFNYGTEADNVSSNSVVLASDSKKLKQHYFTEVKYSKNKNYLIWYTKTGDDKITDEQANTIGDTLEDTISAYNELFGVKFEHGSIYTSLSNKRKQAASALLKKNNIDPEAWRNVLNVYVYDTGSDAVLAHWSTLRNSLFQKIGNDLIMGEEYLNAPYFVFNKRFMDNQTQLTQVANHELFHHYQHLNCLKNLGKSCPETAYAGNFNYNDMSANFASASVSKSSKDSFLAKWSNLYSTQTENGLTNIKNSGGDSSSTGYGAYPYLVAYIKAGGDAKDIMAAHLSEEPLRYLYEKATPVQLRNAITNTAFYALSHSFPDGYVDYTYDGDSMPIINQYSTIGKTTERLKPGAIKYYSLDKGDLIHLEGDSPYITYTVIGDYKNIVSVSDVQLDDISADSCYEKYKICHLAYANASLVDRATISVNVKKLAAEKEYAMLYKNYEVSMNIFIRMNGIATTSKSQGVIDELHQREYLVTTTTVKYMPVDTKIYTDYYHNCSYTSVPGLGIDGLSDLIGGANKVPKWTKSNDVKYPTDLGQIVRKIRKGGEDVTRVDKNHYKLKLNAQDIRDLVQANSETASDAPLPSEDIEAEVVMNGDYVSRIKYDLKNMFGLESFQAYISFSNYNEAGSVYIPLNVINNAE